MKKAAARRAVMAGAEGEAGLDLDADVVRADARAVVRAVHEKAPGAHGREAGQRIGDPVALLRQAESRARARSSSSAAAATSARINSSSGSKPK